jgi:hypothetical protein
MQASALLIAAISLMGFISTFIIFAYNIINNYKEARRGILRSYANHLFDVHKIPNERYIKMLIEIQNIGREKELAVLREQAKQDVINIEPFIEDIERFNQKRRTLTYTGLVYMLACVGYFAAFKMSWPPFNQLSGRAYDRLGQSAFILLIVFAFIFVLWSLLVGVNDKRIEYRS